MASSNAASQAKGSRKKIDYTRIANSESFKKLMSTKKAFILPFTIFFFVFYFALPVMTAYSKVLNAPFAGAITWAWVFAFAQFIMTWALCMIYTKKAASFDAMVDQIRQEAGKGGDSQ